VPDITQQVKGGNAESHNINVYELAATNAARNGGSDDAEDRKDAAKAIKEGSDDNW